MTPPAPRSLPGLVVGSGLRPAVVVVLVVTGGGLLATLATSFGLMPLFGESEATLDGWRDVAPDVRAGLAETLRIAVPATVLAAFVGTGLAILMVGRGAGAGAIRLGCLVVLAVPHVVGATTTGLLLSDGGLLARLSPAAVSWPPLVAGPWPVASVLELAWKESVFVALVVAAVLAPGHAERMEVAAGLGAGRRRRLVDVTLPTARPAVFVSSLIAFVYAVGVYEVPWLLGRAAPEPLSVLAFRLFGSIELGDRPAAAAAALTAALTAGVVAAAALAVATRARATGGGR